MLSAKNFVPEIILIGSYLLIMVDPPATTPTTPIKTSQIQKFPRLACAHGHTLDKPLLFLYKLCIKISVAFLFYAKWKDQSKFKKFYWDWNRELHALLKFWAKENTKLLSKLSLIFDMQTCDTYLLVAYFQRKTLDRLTCRYILLLHCGWIKI